MSGLRKTNKPVKIRSCNDNKKYGVAAKSLTELLKKGCEKLQLPSPGARVCLYADGTIVTEEFFQTLPDNTQLVLLCRDQTWSGVVSDIGQLLSTDRHAGALIEAAKGLLSDERSPKRRKILTDLLLNLEDKCEVEKREEDEDWFRGLDPRFKTKSDYMQFNCGSRIRSYVKELDAATKTIQEAAVRAEFLKTTRCLKDMLRSAKHNGSYFDRTAKEAHRLCTETGWFTCQGSFEQEVCQSFHSINPYGSRESRIVFSTWNLDHRIEKKRTIIPTLLEALQGHDSGEVNLDYFYRLLFTRDNLKLVHIVCHKKEAHHLQCDVTKIFNAGPDKRKGKKRRAM
ncbi:DNA fragmentation factor subunit beta [Spinachia spinachia]